MEIKCKNSKSSKNKIQYSHNLKKDKGSQIQNTKRLLSSIYAPRPQLAQQTWKGLLKTPCYVRTEISSFNLAQKRSCNARARKNKIRNTKIQNTFIYASMPQLASGIWRLYISAFTLMSKRRIDYFRNTSFVVFSPHRMNEYFNNTL